MGLTLARRWSFAFACVLASACSDSTSTTSTGGGGAAQGGSHQGGGGEGTGANMTGGMGEGGAVLTCDTGEHGDALADEGTPEEAICSACFNCAIDEGCRDMVVTFQETPGCLPTTEEDTENLLACLNGAMAVPDFVGCAQKPEPEQEACIEDCYTEFSPCGDLLDAVLSCAICEQCPTNCNAEANCVPVQG